MNARKRNAHRESRQPALHLALLGTSALAALVLATLPATAQQTQQQGGQAANRDRINRLVIIDLAEEQNLPEDQRARRVTTEELYRGVRASRLMNQEVYGAHGEDIGDVKDIFVGRDGRVSAIVVEGGGFLGIGESAYRMPWNEVNLTPGVAGIGVRMTEETAENYGLFDGSDTLLTGPREYRISELIGDYARLSDGSGFGRVSDVVIGRDGRISGVLVTREVGWGGGTYAYPYYGYGYGFDPGLNFYGLPHANPDAAAVGPRVDHDRFDEEVL